MNNEIIEIDRCKINSLDTEIVVTNCFGRTEKLNEEEKMLLNFIGKVLKK